MRSKFFERGAFLISPDVIQSGPLIHLSGDQRLHIENHKGIIEYTPELVRVDSAAGIIFVKGRELLVNEIDTTNILVFGQIESVGY